LVAPTGGSVVEAKDASGLLAAFEAVSLQALGYLAAEGAGKPVSVAPGTKRLAFLGRFPQGTGSLGALTRDGTAGEGAIRFPANGPFSVALVEEPAPGSWQVDMAGAEGIALLEP